MYILSRVNPRELTCVKLITIKVQRYDAKRTTLVLMKKNLKKETKIDYSILMNTAKLEVKRIESNYDAHSWFSILSIIKEHNHILLRMVAK